MKFVASSLIVAASVVSASQDSAYYPGFSNPNTKEAYYYRDAVNVLQGIQDGEFDALYIKYHGCVWSEYGSGEENGQDSGCGGDGGDEFWYMGRTQCFRANVAYSLYGVKAGKGVPNQPCGATHYINSFFTTYGIESFGDYTGVAYGDYGASTTCSYQSINGNNYNYNNNNNNGGNDQEHNQLYYADYNSTTLGCSASGNFIQATFQGAYCDGNHFLQSEGEVSYLNAELESLGCYQIYGGNDNNNGDNGDGDNNNDGGSAEGLLSYSAACSHTEYPKRCPDPHGLKRIRDQRLYNYARSQNRVVPLIMPLLSSLMLLGAILLYCWGNGIRDAAARKAAEATSGELLEPTIAEKFSRSLSRAGTDLSHRTRTFTEKIAEYAEEEEEEGPIEGPVEDYQAPVVEDASLDAVDSLKSADPSVHTAKSADPSVAAAASASADAPMDQSEVANAMLAEKGVVPTMDKSINPATGKKYKRPRMARLSKFVRGRFGRKKNKN